jgi:hypothetical protein
MVIARSASRASFIAVLMMTSQSGHAEPAPGDIEQAKELFRQGNELRKTGDCAAALERFSASRALVPSAPNILNSAFCLSELGRADEALEDYATLITQFKDELSADEIAQLDEVMASLRERIGELQLSINVAEAALTIDGKPRGPLPRITPLRLLPGRHLISVVRDGYEPFETSVLIEAKQTVTLLARLTPIPFVGRLRINLPELEGGSLAIDGARVGALPWEGSLSAGPHWMTVQSGNRGIGPTSIVIVEGQTAEVSPRVVDLGPPVIIRLVPEEAQIRLNGVSTGAGRFVGRLPIGESVIESTADGYLPLRQKLTVTSTTPTALTLRLIADEDHPRWHGPSLEGFIEAHGDFVWGPGLGTGAEDSCERSLRDCSGTLALGGSTELRGGLLFPFGLSVELGLGYAAAQKQMTRKNSISFAEKNAEFLYSDELTVTGPTAVLGAGYAFHLGVIDLKATLLGGVQLLTGRNTVSVVARTGEDSARSSVEGSGTGTTAPTLLLRPEVSFGVNFHDLRLGIDTSLSATFLNGPRGALGRTFVVDTTPCDVNPENVACIPTQTTVSGERAFGPSFAVTHGLSVRYTFAGGSGR